EGLLHGRRYYSKPAPACALGALSATRLCALCAPAHRCDDASYQIVTKIVTPRRRSQRSSRPRVSGRKKIATAPATNAIARNVSAPPSPYVVDSEPTSVG